MKAILILLVILPLFLSCKDQKDGPTFRYWERDPVIAFKRAAEEGKQVFIYFRAVWCSWCEIYDRVLTDEGLESFLKRNFVLLLLDADRDRKDFLKYGGRGTPFTVITDFRGKPVLRFHGTLEPKDLIEVLKVALEGRPLPQEKGVVIRIGRNPGKEFHRLEKLFIEDLRSRFDPVMGGFSSPTGEGVVFKWPTPLTYMYLLKRGLLVKEALFSLRKDIDYLYDSVDGGFFNFFDRTRSFDLYFETSKSLQVNGGMVLALLAAYQRTGEKDFYEKALGTFRYLERHLLDRESGCYLNAQRSDPSYYNKPPQKRRSMKPPPPDTAVIVEYNALTFWALSYLYRETRDEQIIARIGRCLTFIKQRLYRNGRLYRYFDVESRKTGIPDFQRDRAMLALALSHIPDLSEEDRDFALDLLGGGGDDLQWTVRGIRALAFINLGEVDRALRDLSNVEINLSYHNPDEMFFILESLRLLSEMR